MLTFLKLLQSLVKTLLLALPLFVLAGVGVIRYRAMIGEHVRRSHLYKAITASQAYSVYRWFEN
jgi:hypothetical protein